MSSNNLFLDIPQDVFDILTDDQIVALVKKEYAKQHAEPVVTIEPVNVPTFDESSYGRGKDKTPRVSKQKNIPIWEFENFKKYCAPRVYNPKTGMWKVKNCHGGKSTYLPFKLLVKIITDYKQGIHPKETFKDVPLYKTWQGIRNVQYVYRGGGFNDGIIENARKYGYNPQDLISKECEEYWGSINAK